MIEDPLCPVCSLKDFREIGARDYLASDIPSLSDYSKKGYRVLFEAWYPGSSTVRFVSILCRRCGLVIHKPRPGPSELAAKYDVLKRLGIGEESHSDASLDRSRAEELFRAASRLSRKRIESCRVLDYGGGDGRLMLPFREAGCDCELVDLSMDPLPWIRKVGDTLEDPAVKERKYDWIVASHVIEHLADPLAVVRELASLMHPDGMIYIEVPMEIWGKAPLQDNPVTHVNFFTRSSLRYLIESAGMEVVGMRLTSSLHPTGTRYAAIKAVARPSSGKGKSVPPGTAEADRFLSGRLSDRLLCASLVPSVLMSAFHRRITARIRKLVR